MQSGEFENIERIFALVADAPIEQREALIERECSGNMALMARLRSMLAAEQTQHCILDNQAAAVQSLVTIDIEVGDQVAGFQVLEERSRCSRCIYVSAQEVATEVVMDLFLIPTVSFPNEILNNALQDVQTAKAFAHPNLQEILRVGQTDRFLYVACKASQPLGLIPNCERQRLTLPERYLRFHSICCATDFLHRQQVSLQDLPTWCFRLTPEGKAQISGYFLARLFARHQRARSGGQLTNAMEIRNRRLDIFVLGSLLFEMLASSQPLSPGTLEMGLSQVDNLRPVFKIESMIERIYRSKDADAIALRRRCTLAELVSELGSGIQQVVNRALQPTPECNFSECGSLRRQIAVCLASSPSRLERLIQNEFELGLSLGKRLEQHSFPRWVKRIQANIFPSREIDATTAIEFATSIRKILVAVHTQRSIDRPLNKTAIASHWISELDEALSSLESGWELQARVMLLRYFGGFSVKEISRILAQPIRNISQQLHFVKAWIIKKTSELAN